MNAMPKDKGLGADAVFNFGDKEQNSASESTPWHGTCYNSALLSANDIVGSQPTHGATEWRNKPANTAFRDNLPGRADLWQTV